MASTSATKRIVLVFHTICVLLALVLISFGIYILCSYDPNEVGSYAAYAYIGIGVATLLLIFIGCFGALREHVCCTVTFVVLIIIVILAQIVCIAFLFYSESNIAVNLADAIDVAWEEELKSPGAMSIYQSWFGCCGRASPQDYILNERMPPTTCFKNNDNSLPENLISDGCRIAFEEYAFNLLYIFNILGAILIGIELLGAIISCCLCNSIRNDNRRTYF